MLPLVRQLNPEAKDLPWHKRLQRWALEPVKWEVAEEWRYELPDGVTITIPEGFVTDGASIPRIARFMATPAGLLFIPGIIHDYAYKHNSLLLGTERYGYGVYTAAINNREYWDTLFLKVSKRHTKLRVLSYSAYAAVRLFGWIPWNKHRANDGE